MATKKTPTGDLTVTTRLYRAVDEKQIARATVNARLERRNVVRQSWIDR